MIDKVSFAGRETMLTKGLEKGAKEIAPDVVKASSILDTPVINKTVARTVETAESRYFSPFTATGENATEAKLGENLFILG
jgi:hypothetical protein